MDNSLYKDKNVNVIKIEDLYMLLSCRKIYFVEKSINEKLKICEKRCDYFICYLDIYRCMKK